MKVNALWAEDFAAQNQCHVNANRGVYVKGQSYGYPKKVEVLMAYQAAKRVSKKLPSINKIAERCHCSWAFVEKIRLEYVLHGRVLKPSEILLNKDVDRGVGSKTLDEFDRFILLQLYVDEPSRSLKSYRDHLCDYTGTLVSTSTISRFFLESMVYKGGFAKPNLIPIDKFTTRNKAKANDFIHMASHYAPQRVRFGDEKSLKGQELFGRDVRRNPITGEVPPIITDPDFRNTHSLSGFVGINRDTNPIWYRIHKSNNNAEQFSRDIEDAIVDGFLRPWDVLVLDNASYHSGSTNKSLERWLMTRFGIFVLWLPTRTPEWNPIELVWNYLVQKLGTYPLSVLRVEMAERGISTDVVAYVAKDILDSVTHELVEKFYRHCFKNVLIFD